MLLAGILQLVIIFKRQLEEMKAVSYSFAVFVLIFVTIIYIELIRGNTIFEEGEGVDMDEATKVKMGDDFFTSIAIVIFGFSA